MTGSVLRVSGKAPVALAACVIFAVRYVAATEAPARGRAAAVSDTTAAERSH